MITWKKADHVDDFRSPGLASVNGLGLAKNEVYHPRMWWLQSGILNKYIYIYILLQVRSLSPLRMPPMSAQTGLLFWNPDTLTSSFKIYVSFDLFEIIKKSSCFAQHELFSGWLERDSLITWQRQCTNACLGVFTKFQLAHLHGCPRYLVLQRLRLGWRFTVQPTMSGSVARIAELAPPNLAFVGFMPWACWHQSRQVP